MPQGTAGAPASAASRLLPTLHFSTENFSTSQRFDAWQARVSGYMECAAVDGRAPSDFGSRATSWHFGDLLALRSVYSARVDTRSQRKIRTDGIDHYRLTLQIAGALRVESAGRRLTVAPRQILMTDMAQPERMTLEPGIGIVLMLPRDLLEDALPRPLDLHGLVPQGVGAMLLASHLRLLADTAGALTRDEAGSVSRATVQLVAAALAPTAATVDAARPVVEATLQRQICRHIDLHLMDPVLDAGSIGAKFRLSRSTLYRLFEPLGGVAAYIKERRLQRIHALLSGDDPRPLARLAEEHGFKSAAHFSQAFRAQFGYAPSEARSVARTAPTVAPGIFETAAASSLHDWLRSLRD